MKLFIATTVICIHFYSFSMEAPKTASDGNSNQDATTLHLYNFQANDQLNKPQVWFTYKQENLFEACEIADRLRGLILKSKPLLIAYHQRDHQTLEQKKDECGQQARILYKERNILTARIVDCANEYRATPAGQQLAQYAYSTRYQLYDAENTARQKAPLDLKKLNEEFEGHPIVELHDAFNSIFEFTKRKGF